MSLHEEPLPVVGKQLLCAHETFDDVRPEMRPVARRVGAPFVDEERAPAVHQRVPALVYGDCRHSRIR